MLGLLAEALWVRVTALSRHDRHLAEFAVDDVIMRFDSESDPRISQVVTRAMYWKARALDARDESAQAMLLCGLVVERSRGSADAGMRRIEAQAATRKAELLARAGSGAEGSAALDAVISDLEGRADPSEEDLLGIALLSRAALLRNERPIKASVMYGAIAERFAGGTAPEIGKIVARALMSQAIVLAEAGRPDDAELAFGHLVTQRPDDALAALDEEESVDSGVTPAGRLRLAAARLMRAQLLSALERTTESQEVLSSLVREFAGEEDHDIVRIVAAADALRE